MILSLRLVLSFVRNKPMELKDLSASADTGGTDSNAVQSFSKVLGLSPVASNTFISFLSIFSTVVAEFPAEQEPEDCLFLARKSFNS